MRALVYGLAVAGAATVRAMVGRGHDVVAADDTDTPARRRLAADLGVELHIAPDDRQLDALIGASDVVVPAPGVPEDHRVMHAATTPPMAIEPTSPMNTFALGAFHQRNPTSAPMNDAEMMARSNGSRVL